MPITKEAIFEIVKENLIDTLDEDVDEGAIELGQSMKDLGANSLDIVEIVSSSMRQLKVKVPRSELSKLTNIGELVDLLHQVALEKEQAAS